MTTLVTSIICDKCKQSISGHNKPFSLEQRTCEEAALYRLTPDPLFCRNPQICSVNKKCESQRLYGRACND